MEAAFRRFIGVDWSGAKKDTDQREAIWCAVVEDGVLRSLEPGRTRAEVTEHLISVARGDSSIAIGLDFAFGLPEWWMGQQGFRSAPDLWTWAAAEAKKSADWPSGLPSPFWATTTGKHHHDLEWYRATEKVSATGRKPFSTFQLSGNGSVGTQSLRGMPHLLELRAAGIHVWPIDSARAPLVLEVFPRELARRLVPVAASHSGDAFRSAVVNNLPALGGGIFGWILRGVQDAFDAAITAYALWFWREELASLPDLPDAAREGCIWRPNSAVA